MEAKNKKKKIDSKKAFGTAAAVLAVIALGFAFFRFFSVPSAPDPKELLLTACDGLSCVYHGEGYAFVVLAPSGGDAVSEVSAITRNVRRADVCVLTSCDEAGLNLLSVYLGNSEAKTVLVPRGTPNDFMRSLSEKHPATSVQKMPYRKAVIFGDLLLYDTGKKDAMSLSVTHGRDKILHAASPSSGRYAAAFVKGTAIPESRFFAESCFTDDASLDYSASKVETVAILTVSGNEEFYLTGEGSAARLDR